MLKNDNCERKEKPHGVILVLGRPKKSSVPQFGYLVIKTNHIPRIFNVNLVKLIHF